MKPYISEMVLDNGLKFYHIQMDSSDLTLLAHVNAGPVYEKPELSGLSHFVEHMLLTGTAKRPDKGMLWAELKKLGDINSFQTEIGNITTEIRMIPGDIQYSVDLISDMFFNSAMKPEDVDKERKIILDEMKRDLDDIEVYETESLEYSLFPGTPAGRNIAGTVETLNSISADDIREFYESAFNPANMAIFTAGPLRKDEIGRHLAKYFSGNGRKLRHYENPGIIAGENKERNIKINRPIEGARVLVGKSLPGLDYKESISMEVLECILCRMVEERLRYKDALSYYPNATYIDDGFARRFYVKSTCGMEEHRKVAGALKEEMAKLGNGGITDGFFGDAKMSLKKGFILDTSSSEEKAETLHRFWSLGDVQGMASYIDNLAEVKKEDVVRAARKYLSGGNLTCVSIGPFG